MSLAVVDSGGANIASVMQALTRLGAEATFTSDPKVIECAERVILPGVGSARPDLPHKRRPARTHTQ